MLKVFEAFAGVGSQRMALENIGVEHEVVAISEIDKFAIASYEAIHGKTNNLGDISKLEEKDIPDHDLFTYSFPCQDISLAGKQSGFEKGSGTRSSLLWECNRVIESKKPKYLLLENVKNLVGKKFKPDFDLWLSHLESLGYKNYWQVLNAKDYGIPQNRERVFVVSILGEHEPYVFPEKQELQLRLKDVLEDEVEEKFYLDDDRVSRLTLNWERVAKNDDLQVVTNTSATGYNKSNVYHENGISQTLQTSDSLGVVELPVIAASRGRNPSNPSDRTTGAPTEQRLEVNSKGVSNTLTTVQKDNYVLEGVDAHPFSKKLEFRGYKQKEVSPCLLATDYKAPKTILESQANGHDRAVAEKLDTMQGEPGQPSVIIDDTMGFEKEARVYENYSPALRASRSGLKTTGGQDFRIRKLTPLECWRLMGFKDLHFYKAQEVNSNSQLYKQAGNSIVVQVLEAIFKELI